MSYIISILKKVNNKIQKNLFHSEDFKIILLGKSLVYDHQIKCVVPSVLHTQSIISNV